MKILFINHSATRTGAPIVLLRFLRWLKQNKTTEVDVLSLQKGELLDAFSEVCNNHFFHDKNESFYFKTKRVIAKELKLSEPFEFNYPKKDLETIAKNNYDLIYANTVVSVSIASYLKGISQNVPKLTAHLHELNLTIKSYCPELESFRDDIDVTIAVSHKVKNNLITNWRFNESKIEVVYAFSKIPEITTESSDEFIVGASGLVYWRKGPDYFNLVAKYVSDQLPNAAIKFQWVGKISELNRTVFEEDLRKMNINDKVSFIGVMEDPYEVFSKFDVFLMTSKEDPFPLVCVEVGMMGKPIICFKGATGTEEVLEEIEGSVVPYLDVAKMGDSVIRYYRDEQLKKDNGVRTANIFKQFTPEKQCEILFNKLNELMSNSH